MPTQQQIDQIANTIFAAVRSGTPTNPAGLPPILSSLVVAQSKHETATDGIPYSSAVFLDDNNGFGYKYTGNAWQSGPGRVSSEGDHYAHYTSVDRSAKEIVDWIYRRRAEGKFPADLSTITTPEQYAQLLKNAGYFGDALSVYTSGLKRWLQKLRDSLPWGDLALMAALALTFYMVNKSTTENSH
jgi:hypothetical protein